MFKCTAYKKEKKKIFFSFLCSIVINLSIVHAHPHIFAEGRLNIIYNPDTQTIVSLQNVWRFDDIFSSSVFMDFDKNRNQIIDEDERKKISETIYNSLKEYNYFQSISVNGKEIAIKSPKEFVVTFEDNKLMILFEIEPLKPLALAQKIDFRVFDPSFYTSIEFSKDEHMNINIIPEGCTQKLIRPNFDLEKKEANNQLTEEFFNNPKETNIGKILSTKFELRCTI